MKCAVTSFRSLVRSKCEDDDNIEELVRRTNSMLKRITLSANRSVTRLEETGATSCGLGQSPRSAPSCCLIARVPWLLFCNRRTGRSNERLLWSPSPRNRPCRLQQGCGRVCLWHTRARTTIRTKMTMIHDAAPASSGARTCCCTQHAVLAFHRRRHWMRHDAAASCGAG